MTTNDEAVKKFSVRQMTLRDVPAVIALQLRAFPGLPLHFNRN